MKYRFPILLVALAVMAGCADSGGVYAAEDSGFNNAPSNNGSLGEGQASNLLYERQIEDARDAYAAQLQSNPRSGDAATGHALTEILLLPYGDAATALLTQNLGAAASLDDQGDIIYGEQGLLYFISRGVPWEDGDSTAGIKTLLAEKLPWSTRQLDTLDGFVTGLDRPLDLLAENLVEFADSLEPIQNDIKVALGDAEFVAFQLPGAVFYDETLDIVLGKSELAVLGAGISAFRGVSYFFAAYDHAWTLERGFGTTIWEEVAANPEDPDYMDGFTVEDYQVAHINETIGRSLGDASLLVKAREEYVATMESLAQAIDFGVAQDQETSLDWSGINRDVAEDGAEFLRALAAAAEGPTELPFMDAPFTLDLRPIFGDGVTVPEGSDLLTLDVYENEFGATERQIVPDEATLELMLTDISDPPYGSEMSPSLTIAEDLDQLYSSVTGDVANDYERTVSGSF